jgi:SAM-dependent methyltransferase
MNRRRDTPHYRHRFTWLTDLLVSPGSGGSSIYNWGFEVLGGRKHEAFRQRIVQLAELHGDEDVLDAGCGTGLTTLRIAAQYPGCGVCGTDLSPKMIAVARNDAVERGLAVDLHVGSILALPYADGSFDVALTNIMFHHLDLLEKRRAVAEIARVLRASGRFVSAEFGPRARNFVERHLAKGDYTLYPTHLADAGLVLRYEELCAIFWGLHVTYRVAVKPSRVALSSDRED